MKTTKTRGWAVLAAMGLVLIFSGCGAQRDEADNAESGALEEAAENSDNQREITEFIDEDTSTEQGEDNSAEAWEELLGSKGFYLQILAENDEALSDAAKVEFLEMLGFQDNLPFYVHSGEDGYSIVELYYDEEREMGCGIVDGEDTGDYSYGFAFNSCQEISWHHPDPYSVLSVYGTSGEEDVKDYSENYEYDDAGKLLHFWSTGTSLETPMEEEDNEEWRNHPMIDVAFTYDTQDKLTKKVYQHSTAWYMPFGTWFSWQVSHYDERERLAHTASYVTHGSVEGYYIYQDESDVPAYFLELDHGWGVNFYRFSQKNDNWAFGSYKWDPNAQHGTYEIEPGEEEKFLAEQGYSTENLFYEYEYGVDWSPDIRYRLSLYCDENLTRGLGFIRRYVDGEYVPEDSNFLIFTFDGYESYLNDAVGPFSVYSYYFTTGRSTTFLQGETVDEYFREMEAELYGLSFHYDEDGKLMHIGTGVTHGGIDNFYIYKKGWREDEYYRPLYMLEVDPGWGVTFYRFDLFD